VTVTTPALPFSYEEFSDWFDQHSENFLEPAKAAAGAALTQLLDDELQEPQRTRIRVGSGRVKSKTRTWKKLSGKYAGKVEGVAAIPEVVDDLVGLRVVCTNKSDVDRLVDILEGLEKYADGDEPVLAIHGDNKDWRSEPKDSGYRAYHVNLCTSVAQATRRHPVVCELQIRTLLQDSWGELTHEDTYKPGGDVPPLVTTLSKRMADLMATLDDIAEDLRSQLDILSEDSLTEAEVGPGTSTEEEASPPSPAREAAEAFLRDRVGALTRPIPLPTLAWELQREFGGDISNGWMGYGTFTKMLEAVVPDARVSPTNRSYVLPADFDISSYDGQHPGFPRVVSLLKEADKSFPLCGSEHWPRVYSALAAATHQLQWEDSTDLKVMNDLTRIARDETNGNPAEERVSRGQAHYVAYALLHTYNLITDMTANQIEQAFVAWMLSRSTSMGIPQSDSEELESWLRGKGEARV
jgi:ppGpp synthetase/RelA/SpoT-type nucleotidyltranferase